MTFDDIKSAFQRNAPGKYEAFFSAVVDVMASDGSPFSKFTDICKYVKAAQDGMAACETFVHLEDKENE